MGLFYWQQDNPNTYFSTLSESFHYSFPCFSQLTPIPSTHLRDHSSFIPDWLEKACTISCCSCERVGMKLKESAGIRVEKAFCLSLGLASLTNSSSFTMQRLEEKWDTFEWWTTHLDQMIHLRQPLSNQTFSLAITLSPLTKPTYGETVCQLHYICRFTHKPRMVLHTHLLFTTTQGSGYSYFYFHRKTLSHRPVMLLDKYYTN